LFLYEGIYRRFEMHLTIGVSLLALVLAAGPATAQTVGHPPAPALSIEQMEAFLLNARVVSMRHAGNGVTGSQRATLTDGVLTHDAHVQTVDIQRTAFQPAQGPAELNFRDTYRYNVAGYRLARLLGMDNVPVTVERRIGGRTAAVTWWVDGVQFDEQGRLKLATDAQGGPQPQRTAMQMQMMRLFDELIQNRDRNQGNLLWTGDWKLWLVDHTRAFRLGGRLLNPQQVQRCERSMCDRLRQLTRDTVKQAMDGALTGMEIDALMERRDAILAQIDARIGRRGEGIVLFTLPS
jgi:hypothetical protein